MDLNAKKEQFSVAWVKAVAAVAGFGWSIPTPDEESVDLCLMARGAEMRSWSPRLDVQIKCTAWETHPPFNSSDSFSFPLKLKNYEDLRKQNVFVPRILVVVVVPVAVENWLTQEPSALVMRHCGYWTSLRGLPESENATSVSVSIPMQQTFDPPQLQGMMRRLASGNLP
jgi:hypothetical protein